MASCTFHNSLTDASRLSMRWRTSVMKSTFMSSPLTMAGSPARCAGSIRRRARNESMIYVAGEIVLATIVARTATSRATVPSQNVGTVKVWSTTILNTSVVAYALWTVREVTKETTRGRWWLTGGLTRGERRAWLKRANGVQRNGMLCRCTTSGSHHVRLPLLGKRDKMLNRPRLRSSPWHGMERPGRERQKSGGAVLVLASVAGAPHPTPTVTAAAVAAVPVRAPARALAARAAAAATPAPARGGRTPDGSVRDARSPRLSRPRPTKGAALAANIAREMCFLISQLRARRSVTRLDLHPLWLRLRRGRTLYMFRNEKEQLLWHPMGPARRSERRLLHHLMRQVVARTRKLVRVVTLRQLLAQTQRQHGGR
mmetsp:Transcript_2223/g.7034  ORF Transcript_2223/g.7034 Transcript_2223/m.7034 type:complete len:371 (+) Transcript_2223:466-1578(+)